MPPVDLRVGAVLVRGVVGAGLWVVGLSLATAVLSGVGWWAPWVGWPVAVLLAVLAAVMVRRLPVHGRVPATGPALALVATAVAFGVWAGATLAEQLLPRRDAASNLQAAVSLARTHARVVPVDIEVLGGPDVLALPGITLASPAFFAVGGAEAPAIQPQFVIGPAAVHALAAWAGGVGAALLVPALAGAIALLALGLVAGRMVGEWWAVVAAVVTGSAFPMVHVARATYSEPLSLVTLGAGLLALLLAADGEDDGPAARWALLAGTLVGGTAFVRIDGLRETILLLVVAGLALARGRRWPRALLAGAGASTVFAFGAALWLSNQYLGGIARSLVPLVGIGVVVALATRLGLAMSRRAGDRARTPATAARSRHSGTPGPRGRGAAHLPLVLGGLTSLALVVLVTRPLWLVVRQDPDDPGARYVAGMQARQGLPVDGGRTYAEQTVTWLHWYLGPVTLVLAAAALVVLVHRATRHWVAGEVLPGWTAPALVALGSTLMTLWRPGITPDHPWADRRLVIAIPTVVILAVVALSAVARSTDGHRPGRAPRARAVLVGLALVGVLAPTVAATWPHATARVERGELAAVEQACAALHDRDVVLAVDSRAAQEWVQVVRGQCGVPALATTAALRKDAEALASTVARVRTAVAGAGGRLVLLSADDTPADSLQELAGSWTTATSVVVLEDQHVLERRPDGLDALRLTVRLAVPSGP